MAFIGAGFPSAPASVDCLVRLDFLVGSSSLVASFLLTSFGNGAVFSEFDDPESRDEVDRLLSGCFFWASALFDTVWNFISLPGVRFI